MRKGLTLILMALAIMIIAVSCDEPQVHVHTYSEEWESDATSHWHKATCEHTEEVCDKAEHVWGDWEIDKEATVTETGLKHRNCTVCDYKAVEEIEKHVHTFNTETHICSCGHVDDSKEYIAVVDGYAVDSIDTSTANVVYLLDDYTGTALSLTNITLGTYSADGVKRDPVVVNATVTGSGDVTLVNVSTKSITVADDFTGTLTFEGGILEKNDAYKNGEAFLIDSNHSKDASYVFKNMTVDTGTLKGIKIQAAKAVTIEGCTFDGTNLSSGSGEADSQNRSLSAVDITIEKADNGDCDITIKDCTFKNITGGNGYNKDGGSTDTAGAIKIKSQLEKDGETYKGIGKVVITGNTFKNCVRDVVVGKANATEGSLKQYSLRTKPALVKANDDGTAYKVNTKNGWTISDNTSDLAADVGIKVGDSTSGNIRQEFGGCTVYDISTYVATT